MTTNLALYRRYRPENFHEVIGQDHVAKPLMAALRKNRASHAYLFSGPRGCGKTTSARILARCLNCEQGPTDTPCGQCPSCIELSRSGSGSLDVVEIDAASHGGVDDARDLRERATFAPVRDRYKIFIVDEAHMVTSAGFNALLKIVEEPPEHIKFIFATTEPDKVIGTIRSRTHHYPFRLVPPDILSEYLENVCSSEDIKYEKAALGLVIRAGGGSVRDTLSVLDQLIVGADGEGVSYDLAVALLGFTPVTMLDDMVAAITDADGASAFSVTNRVIQSGQDPRRFVEDLLERFRDLIVVSATASQAAAILSGMPQEELSAIEAQAQNLKPVELSRYADVTNAALKEMTGATSPRVHLELLAARLLLPAGDHTERGVGARLDKLERLVTVSLRHLPPSRDEASAVEAKTGVSKPNSEAEQSSPLINKEKNQGVQETEAEKSASRGISGPHNEAEDLPAEQQRPSAEKPEAIDPWEDPASITPQTLAAKNGRELRAAQTASFQDFLDKPNPPGQSPSVIMPEAQREIKEPEGSTSVSPQHSAEAVSPTPKEPERKQEESGPAPATASAPFKDRWQEVCAALEKIRRSTARLLDAVHSDLRGDELVLRFSTEGLRRTFEAGGNDIYVKQAVAEVLGVSPRIISTVGEENASDASGSGKGSSPAGNSQRNDAADLSSIEKTAAETLAMPRITDVAATADELSEADKAWLNAELLDPEPDGLARATRDENIPGASTQEERDNVSASDKDAMSSATAAYDLEALTAALKTPSISTDIAQEPVNNCKLGGVQRRSVAAHESSAAGNRAGRAGNNQGAGSGDQAGGGLLDGAEQLRGRAAIEKVLGGQVIEEQTIKHPGEF